MREKKYNSLVSSMHAGHIFDSQQYAKIMDDKHLRSSKMLCLLFLIKVDKDLHVSLLSYILYMSAAELGQS